MTPGWIALGVLSSAVWIGIAGAVFALLYADGERERAFACGGELR